MMQRRRYKALAALLALAVVAAACGDDDDDDAASDGGDGGGDFTACQVTDTGGVDDRSFNQTAYKGVEDAADELGFDPQFLESQSEADFAPNIQALIDQGCTLVVTVGFLLGDATATAAEENPDQLFAIVDNDLFDTEAEEDRNFDNVAELVFSTDQAAFLAGYVAAAMSETGTVGTYGGINIPTVNIFMKGFELGIDQYNTDNGTAVQLIGWSNAENDGLFTGDFEDEAKGRANTESLIDQGADVIMPVAGPVGARHVRRDRCPRQRHEGDLGRHRRLRVGRGELQHDPHLRDEEHGRRGARRVARGRRRHVRGRHQPRHARERRRGHRPVPRLRGPGPPGGQGPPRGAAPGDHRRRDRDVAGRLIA